MNNYQLNIHKNLGDKKLTFWVSLSFFTAM